jgi:formylglycine-generating enzyme required for sulfatase activity
MRKTHFPHLVLPGLLLLALPFFGCQSGTPKTGSPKDPGSPPGEMVFVKGDTFTMGTDDPESYVQERPAHQARVHDFWIDVTEVTNRQYKAFTDATGYKTVAERKPEWEELKKQLPPETPRPDDADLVPGAMVFIAPTQAVGTEDIGAWWHWVPGASWQHPEGPESNLEGRWEHPVVQIAYEDAEAYAKWAGKRLPSEAEWEYAVRGGKGYQTYAWGNELMPDGKYMANIFQGTFPFLNQASDGFAGSAPVKSYPPNGYGLYDMIGNVWEWTSDWFNAEHYTTLQASKGVQEKGADQCHNPENPYAIERVTKGGSFLCAQNYCRNYRPTARRGTSYDSGASNVGFRCVSDTDPKASKQVASQSPSASQE